MRSRLFPVFVVLALAFVAGSALGQETVHGHLDSHPRLFSWTLPSDTGLYRGYYVGGGAVNQHKAEPRHDEEGTWGWDYQGLLVPRRIMHSWWHGKRYQGGPGAYKTDGPRLYEEK